MSLVGLYAYGGGNPAVGWGWNRGFEARDLAIDDKGLGYYLIHVVVLICRNAAYEVDIRLAVCELLLACVKSGIFRAWDGVDWVAFDLGVLVDCDGLCGCLTGEVFKFGHAFVRVIVGIVDDCCILEAFAVVSLVFEFKRAIREGAEAVVDVFIHGSGEDCLDAGICLGDFSVVNFRPYGDVGGVQHALEHAGVAIGQHRLEAVGKVTVILAEANGDASGDGGVKLRRVETALLAGEAPSLVCKRKPQMKQRISCSTGLYSMHIT
jgi:hypothetical protein